MKKDWRELISQPEYGIKVEKDIMVPMRDGVRLAVNVYRPDAPGKFPALFAMGGYGKELQEVLIPPQPLYINHHALGTMRYTERGVLDILRLLSEYGVEQLVLRGNISLTLGCYFSNEYGTG